MRVIFMGTSEFALPTLKALVEDPNYEVVACYVQPAKVAGRGQKKVRKSSIQLYAEEQSLTFLDPPSLKEDDAILQFADLNPAVAVVAAYGVILPRTILEFPKYGCINVHPSDLPRWRGAAPIQHTIMAGDTSTACCVIQMDEACDTGPILRKKDYDIPPDMTAGELQAVMGDMGAELVLDALKNIDAIEPIPQEGNPTHARKLESRDGKINWVRPASRIYDQIRGLSPIPGAYFEFKGKKIKIIEAKPVKASAIAGTVMNNKLLIACLEDAIQPIIIQPEGKKPMKVMDFLNGNMIHQGTVFE